MNTLPLFRLLLWARWRALVAGVRGIREKSLLMLFVLAGFVIGYMFAGYWMFYRGFLYLSQFPLVGVMLSQRVMFLIFAFVFVMLVFSNLIIGYSTLFKNRETEWLLTLPVSHRAVYRWKFMESLLVSSWALLFLSAPMMAAYGRVNHVTPVFYAGVAVAYAPFIVLPGLLGSWAIMLLVRVLGRAWVKKALLLLAAAGIAAAVLFVKPISETEAVRQQEVMVFDQLLRHTRVSLSPLLPSAWLAKCVLAWGEGLWRQGVFFFLLLLSYALMGLLIGFEIFGRRFYASWSSAMTMRAMRVKEKADRNNGGRRSGPMLEAMIGMLPFLSRPVKALCLKDARLFARDPAQWTQFLIFFGLLCAYVLNLRNISFSFQSDFWELLISYLNLTASALTLSTLTTRFVFPQFSLEGRRLWIVGLAPLGLHRLLMQKLGMACAGSMAITVTLMVTSSTMLNLGWKKTAFFAAAIAMMSVTLCSVAVGLGALFPNLKEDNPSRIVSGFGGTLCLVLSFIYIATTVALLAVPGARRVMHLAIPVPDAVVLAGVVFWSAALSLGTMLPAIRRVNNLEI
jgi:ABC-2 type transport system permease protein